MKYKVIKSCEVCITLNKGNSGAYDFLANAYEDKTSGYLRNSKSANSRNGKEISYESTNRSRQQTESLTRGYLK